eukprot:UN12731
MKMRSICCISLLLLSQSNLIHSAHVTESTSTTQNPNTTTFYTTSQQCATDFSPDPQHICLDYYRRHKCHESLVNGYCCLTCGYISCLNICYNGNISNIPSEYYPTPFNCASDIHPTSDATSGATCKQRKKWNNCGASWLSGYCCSSCPNACNCY